MTANDNAKTYATIAELEAILNSENDRPLRITPDGRVEYLDGKREPTAVLTMKQVLGGEY